MKGNPLPKSKLKRRALAFLSSRFRERTRNGDFYEDVDYEKEMRDLFLHFGLDPEKTLRAMTDDLGIKHLRLVSYWDTIEPEQGKTARFYLEHPGRTAFQMLSHAYVGFHYDQIKPYWQLDRAQPFTIWLVLSSAIVFIGVVRIAEIVRTRTLDANGAFAMATLSLCVASLLLVAAESRFGVIGFAMLSILVADWLGSRPGSRPSRMQWPQLSSGLLLYLALSFLFNTMLLQSADIKL